MKKKIPFGFILDLLYPVDIVIRPMFGCHALYRGNKIVLIVRDKPDHTDANGVWIATGREHHDSLKKEFPSMHSVYILSDGKQETNWQMIHRDDEQFEEAVTRLCEMIRQGDERIGRIPKKKRSKRKKK